MSTFTDANPQFTLYSHPMGPNGWKVAVVLCELGLTYKTIMKEFGNGERGMKTPEYEAINPNGRIPALIDHGANDLIVWESNAIIQYVCRKYNTAHKLWAPTFEEQAQIETWLYFQASGQAPYLGQAIWFTYFHADKLPSAVQKFTNETRRVLGVLQKQLLRAGSNGWLVLGRITAADISFLQWYMHAHRIHVSIEKEFPAVHDWIQRMLARPAIKKGMEGAQVPQLALE